MIVMRIFPSLLLGVVVLVSPVVIAAQEPAFEGVAEYLPVSGEQISDGQIVVQEGEGWRVSERAYEEGLYGVINEQPAVALKTVLRPDVQAVVATGVVSVSISTVNGAIAAGDFITSSDRPGVGMRANDPGVVLGRALASYDAASPEEIGQIPVAIDVHFAVVAGTDVPRSIGAQVRRALVTGAAAAVSDPNTALRYALAAAVMVLSLLFGLLVFGRSATAGIVAVGRNPLARRTILLTVSFNVFMAILFIAGGVTASFFILAF